MKVDMMKKTVAPKNVFVKHIVRITFSEFRLYENYALLSIINWTRKDVLKNYLRYHSNMLLIQYRYESLHPLNQIGSFFFIHCRAELSKTVDRKGHFFSSSLKASIRNADSNASKNSLSYKMSHILGLLKTETKETNFKSLKSGWFQKYTTCFVFENNIVTVNPLKKMLSFFLFKNKENVCASIFSRFDLLSILIPQQCYYKLTRQQIYQRPRYDFVTNSFFENWTCKQIQLRAASIIYVIVNIVTRKAQVQLL